MTTEDKWKSRVEAWKSSGLSADAFSKDKGYEGTTLQYWASRLRRGAGWALARRSKRESPAAATKEPAAATKEPRVVKVVRMTDTESAAQTESAVVIEIGAGRVSVRRGFDRGVLREVLSMLGGGQ